MEKAAIHDSNYPCKSVFIRGSVFPETSLNKICSKNFASHFATSLKLPASR